MKKSHCRYRTSLAALRAALVLFSLVAVLAGGAASVHGQSALDGFDPNANGTVYAVVVQPDGKIVIGGDFTSLSPNGGALVTRKYIARLNPDGTIDSAFDPNADATVRSLALQPDGKILVGGQFSNIGGQTRFRIARLDAVTGLADSFDPGRERFCLFNRGAGGRPDPGGRLFHHHGRTNSQPHRPAQSDDRPA